MKNLITITSILAAGTLCANAGELVTWSDLAGTASKSVSGTSVASWDVSSSGLIWGATQYVSPDSQSVIFTIDLSSIASDKSYALFSVKDNSFNGLVASGISNGTLFLENWNDSTATDSISISSYLGASSTYSSLTLVWSLTKTAYSKNTTTLAGYLDNSFSSAAFTLTGKSDFIFSNTTWQKLNFGGTTETEYLNYVNSVMVANADASSYTLLGAGYMVGSVVTPTQLTNYYNTQVIPEPSMFGLLAGTLALGLAGTRRRRR